MTNRIYKYTLDIVDKQTIMIPQGSKALHVGEQQGKIQLWAAVPIYNDDLPATFHIVGTGHEIPTDAHCFIGTVQMANRLVWHIFTDKTNQ